MLEPYALKGACTVLRGREVSNDLLLPDIGVEPPGEITLRESGPTSLRCLRTRPSDQLAREAEQMTAALLLVRPPADSAGQPRTSIVQVERPRSTGSREGPWRGLSGINRKAYVPF